MEAKQIVFLFLLIPIIISVSSEPLQQHQTFFPTSLPQVTQDLETLSWDIPKQFSDDSESESIVVPLHHVDHLSPSSTSTPESLLLNRLKREAKTIASRNFSSSIISGLSMNTGEYFTRLGVGTSAQLFYLTIDTGSDITWLQCQPCQNCYPQLDPIFDPQNSTSFASVHCNSPLCTLLDTRGCDKHRNQCLYEVTYGDQSTTSGTFSTETLTFGATKLPRLPLGCGNDNKGLFSGSAGLLGLGRGKLSFPAQAGINNFSYCLVGRYSNSSSYLMFGDSSVSRKAVFTRLLTNPEIGTFYYVELKGISVGGTRVRGIKPSVFKINTTAGLGGVIVDSGTSVTWLVQPAYDALRKAFNDSASSDLKPAAEGFENLDTCFDLRGKKEGKVPTVVLHFKGADMHLPASNILIPVDDNGKFCFAFAGTTNSLGMSIIGNVQQQRFRVSFDLANEKIGFAPESC